MADFTGLTVLVTGGSRGIGYATVQAFLAQGARVAVCARDPGRLEAAQSQLRGMGEVYTQAVAVQDHHQVARFVSAVLHRYGGIDVLVNNAGVVWVGDFVDQSYDSIDGVIDVNTKGVMYFARAVLPSMIKQGRGVIINVSSGAGLSGFPHVVSYCTSKFAVVGFTESLHQEVQAYGIRVHGVCPGRVATDMQVQYSGHRAGAAPEKVAGKILQLAGAKARARGGSCVTVT